MEYLREKMAKDALLPGGCAAAVHAFCACGTGIDEGELLEEEAGGAAAESGSPPVYQAADQAQDAHWSPRRLATEPDEIWHSPAVGMPRSLFPSPAPELLAAPYPGIRATLPQLVGTQAGRSQSAISHLLRMSRLVASPLPVTVSDLELRQSRLSMSTARPPVRALAPARFVAAQNMSVAPCCHSPGPLDSSVVRQPSGNLGYPGGVTPASSVRVTPVGSVALPPRQPLKFSPVRMSTPTPFGQFPAQPQVVAARPTFPAPLGSPAGFCSSEAAAPARLASELSATALTLSRISTASSLPRRSLPGQARSPSRDEGPLKACRRPSPAPRRLGHQNPRLLREADAPDPTGPSLRGTAASPQLSSFAITDSNISVGSVYCMSLGGEFDLDSEQHWSGLSQATLQLDGAQPKLVCSSPHNMKWEQGMVRGQAKAWEPMDAKENRPPSAALGTLAAKATLLLDRTSKR